ncbi:MAG: M23 family metallopeptidase [Muribaculaceae bacterium]|nr:M23 family metallopeptidase [Muribaculaceae bacterium]
MKLFEGHRLASHKIKRRYRLAFQSENTLNELWSVKLTRIKVTVVIIIIILSLVALISTIIVSTPLKTLLPGYLKSEQRNEYILNSLKLDSLEQEISSKALYFNNLHDILNDNIKASNINKSIDSIYNGTPTDSLLKPSAIEKEFIKQYDDEEKFNLSILAPLAAEGIVFACPIDGTVKTTDNANNKDGIIIETKQNKEVASIYDGVIISVNESINNAIEIIIQHPNGFISKYYNISSCYIAKGDKVTAGQRIAIIKENNLGLEIWHDGSAVNPKEYITF